MEHRMNLCKEPFDMVKSGEKTIELRLFDEKRQRVNVGDTIVFTSLENSFNTLKTEVLAMHIFKNFTELYENLPILKCGYRKEEVANPNDMLEYYSSEQEEKYGVVGIEIRIID